MANVKHRRVPPEFDGPRGCGLYDLAPLLDNANLVMRVLNVPPGMPVVRPNIGFDWAHVFNHQNLDNIRLVSHNGHVVSSIGIFPAEIRTPRGTISVGGINCFATNPDYRRRGLGEAVLLDAHEKMRANGHHIGLLCTTIEDYYRRFGWEYGGVRLEFVLDRGNIGLLPEIPEGIEVTEDWRSYVADLKVIHDRESTMTLRSQELFELLFERKMDRVFVAIKTRPIAYVGVRANGIREYGGDTEVTTALARRAFEELDDPSISASTYVPGDDPTFEMTVNTPDATSGLPGILVNRGIPRSMRLIGMILFIDPQGLFEALDLSEVKLERSDDGWNVYRGSRTMQVTERELVKLVFGPERFPDFAPDLFPIEFSQWPLDMV